jgi:hypothetical protein
MGSRNPVHVCVGRVLLVARQLPLEWKSRTSCFDLSCLTCGYRERVRTRGGWKCPQGASHVNALVRVVPIRETG